MDGGELSSFLILQKGRVNVNCVYRALDLTFTSERIMCMNDDRVYVLYRGHTDSGPFNSASMTLNEINPVVRDTVTVNGNSSIVVRLVDHNSGCWIMHCEFVGCILKRI